MRGSHFLLGGSLMLLALTGCQTIEHRSEAIPKAPLPDVSHTGFHPVKVWSSTPSAGRGKHEAELQLSWLKSQILTADFKGHLNALEAETGQKVFETQVPAGILAGPSVYDQRIYVTTPEGAVVAYEGAHPSPVWKARVGGTLLAPPMANAETVFVPVLGGTFVALSAKDGKERWRYSVTAPSITLRKSSRPILFKDLIIAGFPNGKLMAFHQRTGALEWQSEISMAKGRSDLQRMHDISASPVLKDGVIYAVSYQGRVAALLAETGELLWEKEISSYSGMSISNHAVYISDVEGVLYALNRQSGDVLWKTEALKGRQLTTPQWIGDYVVVGDEEGYAHWLCLKKGTLLARERIDSQGIVSAPLVKGNVIYLLGASGKISALKLPPSSQLQPSP